MKNFNIYLTGVGGQGIGLLSEVILRASDYAGYITKSVDTHGVAQRGGIVVSQIRIGDDVYSPLIAKNNSDLVIALERHEALRALITMLRKDGNGILIYYDTVWQPDSVRLAESSIITEESLSKKNINFKAKITKVIFDKLKNSKMQNIVLLAEICCSKAIPGIKVKHYEEALLYIMKSSMLETNMSIFRDYIKIKSMNLI